MMQSKDMDKTLCWSAQTREEQSGCWWYGEFLLNGWGAFAKKEERCSDSGGLFGALLCSRQDGAEQELSVRRSFRQAIKWSKVTDAVFYPMYGVIELYGNRSDVMTLELATDMYEEAASFVAEQRALNPIDPAPDADAAKWSLWAGDASAAAFSQTLEYQLRAESVTEREITKEALELTVLDGYGDYE